MSLSNWDVYAAWAPDGSVWSQWAKPVVFANLPRASSRSKQSDAISPVARFVEALSADPNTAWIIDLPGPDSVAAALYMSRIGYRPVPLFNGAPSPPSAKRSMVDTSRIAAALCAGAAELQNTDIPDHAPPAFMLDALRTSMTGSASPGVYDNRWITLPQDFPSARFLLEKQIHAVCVLQPETKRPADDLLHVLRRWQDSGIRISRAALDAPGRFDQYTVLKPALYKSLFYRTITRIGLKRHSAGGFGALIPEPTEGGGYYG